MSEAQELQNFANFLISKNILENAALSPDSETLSKFYQIFQGFHRQASVADETFSANGVTENNMEGSFNEMKGVDNQYEEPMPFETKAIFTLADFLKQLQANEYYDIAQKFYSDWLDERLGTTAKLTRMHTVLQKCLQNRLMNAFFHMKAHSHVTFLEQENNWLREKLEGTTHENELLRSERQRQDNFGRKKNQMGINKVIQPLRSNSKQRSDKKLMMNSRESTNDVLSKSARGGADTAAFSQSLRPPQSYRQTISGNEESTSQHSQSHINTGQPIYERQSSNHRITNILHDTSHSANVTNGARRTEVQFIHTGSSKIGGGTTAVSPHQQKSSKSRTREERSKTFERLSRSQKKFNPQMLDLQKEREELRQCTFHPETNFKSQILVERQNLNYQDKDQLCQRLYKHAETKGRYLESLKALKDHVELRECTFHPERMTKGASPPNIEANDDNIAPAFERLHQYHEVQQMKKIRQENMLDQQFKENHPFQPNRVTKGKDTKYLLNAGGMNSSAKRETSKQRSNRMYLESKMREDKIALKRRELQIEEDKMKKMTFVSDSQQHPPRSSRLHNFVHTASNQSPASLQRNQDNQQRINELYTSALRKDKKQEALREKVYKEQGFTFKPNIGNSSLGTSSIESQELMSKDVVQRNYEFLERKEQKIRELGQRPPHDFKPQRETSKSRLSQQVNEHAWSARGRNQKPIAETLLDEGIKRDEKVEKMRQHYAVDPNCTFKPQISKLNLQSSQVRSGIPSYPQSSNRFNNYEQQQQFYNDQQALLAMMGHNSQQQEYQ